MAELAAVAYHLPERVVTNDDLAGAHPEWRMAEVQAKTGIVQRHVAAPDETSGDLAVAAARELFATSACRPESIDFILLCTQTPDYLLPTTACVLQQTLGIPTAAGALDFNLGCSGYVYGLSLAKGLIESGQARSVLLLTAETYTKLIHPDDRAARVLFGDGASATWVKDGGDKSHIGPFVFGTDGAGARHLLVPAGGMREPRTADTSRAEADSKGNVRSRENLFMNGAEVFAFTLRVVPNTVARLLDAAHLHLDDVDYFVFHQANAQMIEHLRQRIGVRQEKVVLAMRRYGNTVSSTIPIALRDASLAGAFQSGARIMLVGFGVGFSWGATLIRWP